MNKLSRAHIVKSLPWIFLAFWVFLNPQLWQVKGFFHQVNTIGSFFGVASFFLFSFALLFITKWKKLEDWFGGLDKVFRFHQFLGKIGYFLLTIHVFIFSLKWAERGLSYYFLYLLPIHQRFSVNLGSYAFILMTLLLGITIFKIFPYHLWKRIHKWMSAVFLMSFLHFLLSNKVFGNGASNTLLYISGLLGLTSATYKQLLFRFFVKSLPYKVIKAEPINKTLLKVTLQAKGKAISSIPGQYAFIHFEEPNFPKEEHPFVLSRDEKNDRLLIYVKNRGDYTQALHQLLKTNWTAFLEGPYGRLDYRLDKKQIWIAGGIGIALFLSWIYSLQPTHNKIIDLFFCCHSRSDLSILQELEELKSGISGIRIFTFCSENKQRLSSAEIIKICPDYKDRKIFMCGPRKLTRDMRKQFQALSVKKSNIEYEDFDFF